MIVTIRGLLLGDIVAKNIQEWKRNLFAACTKRDHSLTSETIHVTLSKMQISFSFKNISNPRP